MVPFESASRSGLGLGGGIVGCAPTGAGAALAPAAGVDSAVGVAVAFAATLSGDALVSAEAAALGDALAFADVSVLPLHAATASSNAKTAAV